MSASDEFFAQRRAAAAFKHGILERYPVVFAGKAGSITSGRVVFLDGYAGPGRYGMGRRGRRCCSCRRRSISVSCGR